MPSPIDRDAQSRGHRRHQFRSACTVRAASDDRLVGDLALDVSYSGLRVRAATDAVRIGERVKVALQIPDSKLWIHGEGRVQRAIVGRRASDDGPSIGVRLDRMDGMSRVLLTSIAHTMPLVPATRGARRDYAETVARIAREG